MTDREWKAKVEGAAMTDHEWKAKVEGAFSRCPQFLIQEFSGYKSLPSARNQCYMIGMLRGLNLADVISDDDYYSCLLVLVTRD